MDGCMDRWAGEQKKGAGIEAGKKAVNIERLVNGQRSRFIDSTYLTFDAEKALRFAGSCRRDV